MSDKGPGEKTEKPTPKRIRDARKKGQVAKTMEASVAMRFIVITIFFMVMAKDIFWWMEGLITMTFKSSNDPLQLSLAKYLHHVGSFILTIWIPFSIVMFVLLCASFIFQVGFLFVTEPIKPTFKKLNPIEGVKNLFSKKKLFDLFKNILRVVVLGVIFFYLLMHYRNSFQFLPYYDVYVALLLLGRILFYIMIAIIIFSVIISVVDFIIEKRRLTKQLMMSMEDIKKEYKETEGSPEIKSKRKELHNEIQSGSLGSKVKKSSAVVRNPTEIAVCLYYNIGETPLPIVVEKGSGRMARRILQLAKQYNIPVVNNVPVARRLYKMVDVGDYIGRDMIVAVAAILKSVMTAEQKQEVHHEKYDE